MIQLLLILIYLSFISLGLPDALLGAAWPTAYPELSVPMSYAGIISVIICAGTVVSSLLSDRLNRRFSTAMITTVSVATTAVALLGFSFSKSFWLLCLWAIPYGLGAGSVDSALNNYVALHYKSRHMSWLHCMWGVGALIGPYIMGAVLTMGHHWTMGYRTVGFLQTVLTVILILSLPIWKIGERKMGSPAEGESGVGNNDSNENSEPVGKSEEKKTSHKEASHPTMLSTLTVPGVTAVLICFFCYSAVEQTAGLWASSYLTMCKGVSETEAAFYASLFYIGIAVGRALSGFATIRFNDKQMVRIGCVIISLGIALMFLPFGKTVSLIGFLTIGFGCAPIFPCLIHATPERFGENRSQAVIGLQMAIAYLGTLIMPPLFGVLAQWIGVTLMPFYLGISLILMVLTHEWMIRKTSAKSVNV